MYQLLVTWGLATAMAVWFNIPWWLPTAVIGGTVGWLTFWAWLEDLDDKSRW